MKYFESYNKTDILKKLKDTPIGEVVYAYYQVSEKYERHWSYSIVKTKEIAFDYESWSEQPLFEIEYRQSVYSGFPDTRAPQMLFDHEVCDIVLEISQSPEYRESKKYSESNPRWMEY